MKEAIMLDIDKFFRRIFNESNFKNLNIILSIFEDDIATFFYQLKRKSDFIVKIRIG